MKHKFRLMTPGPAPVPEDVLLELARPVFHHRTDEFRTLHRDVISLLRDVFQTEQDVFVLTCSGTGAMEAAVVNTLAPGAKAIVASAGRFGDRWKDLCEAYGVQVVHVAVPWGDALDPSLVAQALDEHPDAAAVLTTLSETSTGVGVDVEAIGQLVRPREALLIVDGISGVGAMPMRTDAWGVDLLAVGSQKALMLPPGLAFLTVSAKAWKRIEQTPVRSFYLNLPKARTSQAKGDTPFTPAHTLMLALQQALRLMQQEGIEQVWHRHHVMSRAMQAGARAMGLRIFAARPAQSLTTIEVPAGVDGVELVGHMRKQHGLKVAGGQDKLKGKIVRIAHMGYMDPLDCLTALCALEMSLAELGCPVELGRAAAAAQQVFVEESAGAQQAAQQ